MDREAHPEAALDRDPAADPALVPVLDPVRDRAAEATPDRVADPVARARTPALEADLDPGKLYNFIYNYTLLHVYRTSK